MRKLGTAGSAETAARPSAARSEQATKANATTRAVIAEIRRAGKTTLTAIAQELEVRGVRTPAGRDCWATAQVSRLLAGLGPVLRLDFRDRLREAGSEGQNEWTFFGQP
jgi:hypothetical protein